MRESGKVVKILQDSKIEIEMRSTAGCNKCGLCRIGLNDKAYLTAKTDLNVSIGDTVEVEMSEKEVVLVAFLVFILPLILFFIGYAFLGYIFAGIVLASYYLVLWLYDRDSQKKEKFLPFVTRKI